MKHPLEFVPLELRKPFFSFFLVLTILIFALFNLLDQPMRTNAAPNGIVSFELAFTQDAAQSMLDSWDENARLFAAFGLGFDYLFMPVYAFALSLGLLLVGANKPAWYSSLSVRMAWAAFVAVVFDAVENYALWRILTGSTGSYPQLAGICASIKFSLLLLGLVTALAGIFLKKRN